MEYILHNATEYVLKVSLFPDEYLVQPNRAIVVGLSEGSVLEIGRTQGSHTFTQDKDMYYNIIVKTKFSFKELPNVDMITITSKSERFQNKTYYEYCVLDGMDKSTVDVIYEAMDRGNIESIYKGNDKKKKIYAMFIESFFGIIFLYGILFVILWIGFNGWVALGAFVFLYLLDILTEICFNRKARKKKWRFLAETDDVIYLMNHLDKYCSQ